MAHRERAAAWRDLRVASLAAAGGVVASLWLPSVGPLCPLRRISGVPCPLCGTTTAATALLQADPAAALAANPVIVAVVVVVALAWLAVLSPRLGRRLPAPRLRPAVAAAGGAALWLYQLHRFDHL